MQLFWGLVFGAVWVGREYRLVHAAGLTSISSTESELGVLLSETTQVQSDSSTTSKVVNIISTTTATHETSTLTSKTSKVFEKTAIVQSSGGSETLLTLSIDSIENHDSTTLRLSSQTTSQTVSQILSSQSSDPPQTKPQLSSPLSSPHTSRKNLSFSTRQTNINISRSRPRTGSYSRSNTKEAEIRSPSTSSSTSEPLCSACGYDLQASLVMYPGVNGVYSTVSVTATRLTFTYVFPDGSSSLSYSMVANYTSTANITTPFVKPTSVGTFAPPPTWIFSGQTLTAGTTYAVITGADATTYRTMTQTAAMPAMITPAPVFPKQHGLNDPSCSFLQVSANITGVPAYSIGNNTASSIARSLAIAEFFGKSSVQRVFGPNPVCTQIMSIGIIILPPDSTNTVIQPTKHSTVLAPSARLTPTRPLPPIPPPPPPVLTHPHPHPHPDANPPADESLTPPVFVPSTYVTASVLTVDGPGTVIYAPTAPGQSTHAKPLETISPKQISPDQPNFNPLAGPPPLAQSLAVPQGLAVPLPTSRDGNLPGQPGRTGALTQTISPTIVGGSNIIPIGGGSVIIGSQTIGPGEETILPNGIPITIDQGGSQLIVGTQTVHLVDATPASPVILPGGITVTPVVGGNGIIVNDQTIKAGVVTNLPNGQQISVGPGNIVVVDGQTSSIPVRIPAAAPVTIPGAVITPIAGGGIIVNGQTIRPGEVATFGGHETISVALGGTAVVVNGITAQFIPVAASGIPFTLGGVGVTALPGGSIAVGGQTIAPGSTITLSDGGIIAVPKSGSVVVVNGQTVSLPFPTAKTGLLVNGEFITPISGGFVVDGKTLTAGQVITASDGQIVSVGTNGIIAVGKSTIQITHGAASTTAITTPTTTLSTPAGFQVSQSGTVLQSGVRKGEACSVYRPEYKRITWFVMLALCMLRYPMA